MGFLHKNKIKMVLVRNTVIGAIGDGDKTLMSSSESAKKSLVTGLFFDSAFVYAYLSISADKLK